MIIVTGGAGFIGANFVIDWVEHCDDPLSVIDSLTYAGNLANLDQVSAEGRFDGQVSFYKVDLLDAENLGSLIHKLKPSAIIHFAAESHVDRSIDGPGDFIQTNVIGTFNLLQASRSLYRTYLDTDPTRADKFRFLHVSTDEVYGSLGLHEPAFSEKTPYAPNSPYAASKAASDHLVRAWHHTYGLPTLTTNCSNNYGPFQFPEKLIPLIISHALAGEALPIYGDGQNIRDWLYVKDHCSAIRMVLEKGTVGEVYNIGGYAEMTNLAVVEIICEILDRYRPRTDGSRYQSQIAFVSDRPGHDRRYAVDASKIRSELGWRPSETFVTGIEKTIAWYLGHADWMRALQQRKGLM